MIASDKVALGRVLTTFEVNEDEVKLTRARIVTLGKRQRVSVMTARVKGIWFKN